MFVVHCYTHGRIEISGSGPMQACMYIHVYIKHAPTLPCGLLCIHIVFVLNFDVLQVCMELYLHELN